MYSLSHLNAHEINRLFAKKERMDGWMNECMGKGKTRMSCPTTWMQIHHKKRKMFRAKTKIKFYTSGLI